MGFPKHLDTILNWTEEWSVLSWTELYWTRTVVYMACCMQLWCNLKVKKDTNWQKSFFFFAQNIAITQPSPIGMWSLEQVYIQLFYRALNFGGSVEKQPQAND